MVENPSLEELAFEDAFNELETIIMALEAGEHSLEESLNLFERGQALARHCAGLLDGAELKIRQILGEELLDFSQ